MESPDRIGRYRIVQLLSMGGMGELYLARSEGPAGFSKTLVVKRILRHMAKEASAVELFLREARLAALLSHPNVVQIFELGEEESDYFIAMEYVHGQSARALRTMLKNRGRLCPPLVAAAICAQALRGLHCAHSMKDAQGQLLGIVHRDVSPDNILVAYDGSVKVTDFGIAKMRADLSVTVPGRVRGKFGYLSPEQLRQGEVDRRADIYGMGAVLYELLTGQRHFDPSSDVEFFDGLGKTAVRPVRALREECSAALEEVVLRALRPEPAERFSSAEEMARALEAAFPGEWSAAGAQISELMTELFGADAANRNPAAVTPWLGADGSAAAPPLAGAPQGTAPLVPDAAALTRTELVSFPKKRRVPVVFAALTGIAAAAAVIALRPSAARTEAPEVTEPAPIVVAPTTERATPPEAAEPVAQQPLPKRVERAPEPEPAAAPARPRPLPAQRVRPEPPAAAQPGLLSVRASPWAEVRMGARVLGITPLARVEVPAGRHLLVLRNEELGVERKVSVEVIAGREVVVKEDLRAVSPRR